MAINILVLQLADKLPLEEETNTMTKDVHEHVVRSVAVCGRNEETVKVLLGGDTR